MKRVSTFVALAALAAIASAHGVHAQKITRPQPVTLAVSGMT